MWRYLLFYLCMSLSPTWAIGSKASQLATEKTPTKEEILQLANGYIDKLGPGLTGTDFLSINALKFDLASAEKRSSFLKPMINDRVSQFTILLAGQKSLPALTVASAYLVRYAPTNPRTTNLLANVVALIPERDHAVKLLDYTLSLQPDSTLAMINLANASMNANKDERARLLLEKVVANEPENSRALRMLACYWYKKGDNNKTVEYLMKAAALSGFRLKKSKNNEAKADKDETKPGDSEEELDRKTEDLKAMVPVNTADLIENDFPDIAQQIRDHVEKLMDHERMGLPQLPSMNANDLKDYVRNRPVYRQWLKCVDEGTGQAVKEVAMSRAAEMGISPTDSKAEMRRKARAEAQKQMNEQMKKAMDMLQAMKDIPGMSNDQIERAQRELKNAGKKQGVNLDTPDEGAPVLDMKQALQGVTDTGGLYAAQNYGDYLRIKSAYVNYFIVYFQKYGDKVSAIQDAYDKLAKQEKSFHEQVVKQIAEEGERELKAAERSGGAPDLSASRLKILKEQLRHVRKMNELGSNFYRQWVNLFMPQYAQKMKPKLEAFWYVTALYIRNMNNPEIMKREYDSTCTAYWSLATKAASNIQGGEMFPYSPESDEEAKSLEEEIRQMEKVAEEKRKQEFEPQTKVAANALPKWLEEKLAFSVACEFLALKITPHNIEFEAYIPGISGKVEYDFEKNEISTSTALTVKMNIGVQIGPLEAKLEGEVNLLGSKTTFDLNDGKVLESSDGFAKGSIKGEVGKADSGWEGWTPSVEGRVGGTIQIDPALDNEVSGKVLMMMPGGKMDK